ncbi:MAG: PAS domain S-box protein [Patescibacteria group bacterium]
MPKKKSLIKSLAKKLSLELIEGDIIKITGIALTILVATQIIFTKGSHLIKEMSANVLGTHESSEVELSVAEHEDSISEDFYKEIVEGSKSIILKWDADGMITYMNPFGAEFFGYTQDEIIGKSIFLLVPGVESITQRDLNQMLRDIQKNPENFQNSANENIKKSGEQVWMIWTNSAIYSDGKNEVLSIGNEGVRDINP